jgi:hypothetical protein
LPIVVDYPQTSRDIGIYGYPEDKAKLDYPNIFMYGMTGKFELNNEDLFIY